MLGFCARLFAVVVCATGVSACAQSSYAPFYPYDGSVDDAGPEPGVDSDRDGICDSTEINVGTNPLLADSDGDGFPDDIERTFNADPQSPGEPARDEVVYISEAATAPFSVMPLIRVRGMGQSFTGYAAAGSSSRAMGVTSLSVVDSGYARDALPRSNVFRVVTEDQRFEGVVGTTQLLFELRLFAGSMEARDCRRAFIVYYRAKTNEGSIYGSTRYLVIVTPDVDSEHYEEWCVPTSCY